MPKAQSRSVKGRSRDRPSPLSQPSAPKSPKSKGPKSKGPKSKGTKSKGTRSKELLARARRRHPDIETAAIAVKYGYLSEERAREALREAKSRAKDGKERLPYLRLLVRSSYLTRRGGKALAREIERHTYICGDCDKRCVLAPSRSKESLCPRCGAFIEGATTEASMRPVFETERDDTSEPPGLNALIRSGKAAFGRYEILEELGRGAMGVVYRARHIDLKRELALKVLIGGVGASETHVARFRREAGAVARLAHPNIVRVTDFGSEDDLHFLAMDLVEGGKSLQEALKNPKGPKLRERMEMLSKVCEAVHHAHEEKIIHRDLKPANILLDPNGRPLVADFGLAKDYEDEDELTHGEARVGTPLFIAPELVRVGSVNVDPRGDVWSIGVMVFISVTGHYPFRCKTLMELYIQVLQDEPDWDGARSARILKSQDDQTTKRLRYPFVPGSNEGWPADLKVICEKSLAKNPAHRYQSAKALGEDLRRWLDAKPIRARPLTSWERLSWKLRQRKTSLVVASALILALCTGLFSLGLMGRAAQTEKRQAKEVDEAARRAWYPALDEKTGFTTKAFSAARQRLAGQLEGDPKHPRKLYFRGLANLHLMDDEAAEADLSMARQFGDPVLAADAAHALALLRLLQGRHDEALALTKDALPEAKSIRIALRARIRIDRGRRKDLEEAGAEIAGLKGALSANILTLRGTIWSLRGKPKNALRDLNAALEADPSFGEAILARLAVPILAGKSEDAKGALASLRKLGSKSLEGLANLPRYYLKLGKAREKQKDQVGALEAWRRAGVLAYWFPEPHVAAGDLLRALDRVNEAIDAYSQALHRNPGLIGLDKRRAALLGLACTPRDLRQAERIFQSEVDRKGDSGSRQLTDLGVIKFSLGKLDEAKAFLQQSYRRSSDRRSALFLLAIAREQRDKKNLEKLEIRWKRIKKRSSRRKHLLALARAQLHRGRETEARAALKEAEASSAPARGAASINARLAAFKAILEVFNGDTEAMFKQLEQAASVEGGISSYELDGMPYFKPFRANQRFLAIRNKLIRKAAKQR